MLWLVKLIILKKFVASLIKKLIVEDILNVDANFWSTRE